MAKNFVQPGDTMQITASGPIVSGTFYHIGTGMGVVALSSAASGEKYEGAAEGAFELDKKAATAMSQGDLVDWDNGNEEVVPDGDGASDGPCGRVWADAAGSASKVIVKINKA